MSQTDRRIFVKELLIWKDTPFIWIFMSITVQQVEISFINRLYCFYVNWIDITCVFVSLMNFKSYIILSILLFYTTSMNWVHQRLGRIYILKPLLHILDSCWSHSNRLSQIFTMKAIQNTKTLLGRWTPCSISTFPAWSWCFIIQH